MDATLATSSGVNLVDASCCRPLEISEQGALGGGCWGSPSHIIRRLNLPSSTLTFIELIPAESNFQYTYQILSPRIDSSLQKLDPGLVPGSWVQDLGSKICDPGSWVLDPGSWIHDAGSRILVPGSWIQPGSWIMDPKILDPGSWIQDHGYRILDPGSWIPGSWIRDPGSRILDPGAWILDPGLGSWNQDP